MTIDQLRYIVEIADIHSITKAAKNLFVAQSNLSHAVKKLEEEIGKDIFLRSNNGTQPTEFGERFIEKAREIIERFDDLYKMGKAEDESGEMLKIIAFPTTIISRIFTEFLEKYQTRSSEYQLMDECSVSKVLKAVREEKAELGFLFYVDEYEEDMRKMFDSYGVKFQMLTYENPYVYISKDNKAISSEKTEITPDELKGMLLVQLVDKNDTLCNCLVPKAFGNIENFLHTRSLYTLLDMCTRSDGYCVGIETRFQGKNPDVSFRRLKLKGANYKIKSGYIVKEGKKETHQAKKFLELVRIMTV